VIEALPLLDALRAGVGGLIAAIGLGFMLGGAIGLLRYPDFYTRLHAVSVADGVGAACFVLGLAVMAPDLGMALRLLLLAALIVALGPVLAHLLASSAHAGGLAPIAGRYTTPRPGPPRRQETPP
jgi:multicomponent Na+:H+ antiporter subunit G